jgi:hypothetical protein
MSQRSLARRLKRIRETLQPPNSLAARVEMLPENDRLIYLRWKTQIDWQHAQCANQSINAWGNYLDNPADWPRLPPDINRKLWADKPMKVITADMGYPIVTELYKEFAR